jgi:NADPH:quinone reductase-like Zn-dependent oxidoreductase
MPKMVRFQEVCGSGALKIEEERPKQPRMSEVRLRVQEVGLNRLEVMFFRGQYEPPKLPAGVGWEAVGIVEAVGPSSPRRRAVLILRRSRLRRLRVRFQSPRTLAQRSDSV